MAKVLRQQRDKRRTLAAATIQVSHGGAVALTSWRGYLKAAQLHVRVRCCTLLIAEERCPVILSGFLERFLSKADV
jgi:hypothetical protein